MNADLGFVDNVKDSCIGSDFCTVVSLNPSDKLSQSVRTSSNDPNVAQTSSPTCDDHLGNGIADDVSNELSDSIINELSYDLSNGFNYSVYDGISNVLSDSVANGLDEEFDDVPSAPMSGDNHVCPSTSSNQLTMPNLTVDFCGAVAMMSPPKRQLVTPLDNDEATPHKRHVPNLISDASVSPLRRTLALSLSVKEEQQ